MMLLLNVVFLLLAGYSYCMKMMKPVVQASPRVSLHTARPVIRPLRNPVTAKSHLNAYESYSDEEDEVTRHHLDELIISEILKENKIQHQHYLDLQLEYAKLNEQQVYENIEFLYKVKNRNIVHFQHIAELFGVAVRNGFFLNSDYKFSRPLNEILIFSSTQLIYQSGSVQMDDIRRFMYLIRAMQYYEPQVNIHRTLSEVFKSLLKYKQNWAVVALARFAVDDLKPKTKFDRNSLQYMIVQQKAILHSVMLLLTQTLEQEAEKNPIALRNLILRIKYQTNINIQAADIFNQFWIIPNPLNRFEVIKIESDGKISPKLALELYHFADTFKFSKK